MGVLLDSQLLLKEQVGTVLGGLCTDLFCATIALISGQGDTVHSHFHSGHFIVELQQCTLDGAALEDHLEITSGSECTGTYRSGCSNVHPIALLLHELYCLPLSFQVQFKVLVITLKILNGTGPSYLWDHLS